jgi:hypothetical protein
MTDCGLSTLRQGQQIVVPDVVGVSADIVAAGTIHGADIGPLAISPAERLDHLVRLGSVLEDVGARDDHGKSDALLADDPRLRFG